MMLHVENSMEKDETRYPILCERPTLMEKKRFFCGTICGMIGRCYLPVANILLNVCLHHIIMVIIMVISIQTSIHIK